MTLTELCQELNNWFEQDKIYGSFEIVDGHMSFDPVYLQDGQWFRIVGSVFNDGVYQYPVFDLKDETFGGAIWAMAVPKAVEDLAKDITAYELANADVIASPYNSESFGGYSYSKGTGNSSGGSAADWQAHFARRLNKWRKLK